MNKQKMNCRIAVIGCGAIADLFHLPVLAKLEATQGGIVIADPSEARLLEMKNKYNIAEATQDYRELLGKVDGVLIATPPKFHFEIAKFFLENGIPVLSEKPLVETAEEAYQLQSLSHQHKVPLAVNQTRRFFPSYGKIRELIDDGVLGTLQSIVYHDGIEFDWPAASQHHFSSNAKGALSDTGIHLLDAVNYWVGEGSLELVESLSDSQGGPEAMATVRLKHQECDIEVKVSRLGRLQNGFKIIGSRAQIEAGAEDFSEVIVEFNSGSKKKYKCGRKSLKYTDFAEPLLTNFVEVIRGSADPTVSVDDVVEVVELLERAYQSATPYPAAWNRDVEETIQPVSSNEIRVFDNPRILITGASGFLGGRINEIVKLAGYGTPIPTIRNWTRAARLARLPVDIRLCDMLKPETIDEALQDVDVVVHCAKVDTQESIVNGTRNLLQGCVKNQVRRFVHISTAEVYGPDVTGVVTEEHPTPTTGRPYGDYKIEAESVVAEFSSQGLETAILRPSLIHGPYSNSWSINLVKRLQSGKWGRFDEHGEGIANLIYVDDLVQAIMLCAAHPDAAGQTFNVNGMEKVTWNQYFDLLNSGLQRPPLKDISATKSKWRTRMMGMIGSASDLILDRFEDRIMDIYMRGGWPQRVMKKIKGELDSTPDNAELNDLFIRPAYYDDQKIQSMLGYRSTYSLETSIQKTLHWMRLHELISELPEMELLQEDLNVRENVLA